MNTIQKDVGSSLGRTGFIEYLCGVLKPRISHIISIFFLAIFLFNGIAPLLPLLTSPEANELAELVSHTESESSGKEKEEKVPERDLIHHDLRVEVPSFYGSLIHKNSSGHIACWDDITLAVLTPPPEQA